ncbi:MULTISPECIES: hypothetical protein [unclassified Lebetimonas]|uniref:hypothetical protein n=1 Tax=unclassified Lebetimonas TaxID=2648158 RepID=UPI0004B99F10|nr:MULTISPECIES: hypothetical protein [unclassified Lebetimonas]
MAYKLENGKIKRVSLPKKLSKKNEELLEKYWEKTPAFENKILKKFSIKTINGN